MAISDDFDCKFVLGWIDKGVNTPETPKMSLDELISYIRGQEMCNAEEPAPSCDCIGCRGEEPPKQPNLTIEEIEKDVLDMTSNKEELEEWIASRPPLVQEAAKKFLPWNLYRVKEGAPYKYTVAGSIVAVYKFTEDEDGSVGVWFRVLRSPLGYAGIHAEIDPEWLELITLEQLLNE